MQYLLVKHYNGKIELQTENNFVKSLPDTGEILVKYRHVPNSEYFTTDPMDAFKTAVNMANRINDLINSISKTNKPNEMK